MKKENLKENATAENLNENLMIKEKEVNKSSDENNRPVARMNVKILNIRDGLKTIDNVSIIKIKSKKYNLSIMEDYLPVIGEVDGDVEIVALDDFVKLKNIIGYFMLKHNEFKLFIKEE